MKNFERMPAESEPTNKIIEYIKKTMKSREQLEEALEKARKYKQNPESIDKAEVYEAKEKYEKTAGDLREMRDLFSSEENIELNRIDDLRMIDLQDVLEKEKEKEAEKSKLRKDQDLFTE